ncbi:25780_t:CDS:2 [Dentiscutata erythropus]|uniref:25780_t:CDS:1 n=1 Tax=Dentiscutata erythropus TaxID=1348616 RepID=A0A9N9CI00_9GLOM|nr:25780_t:CDS:2 [Dentiscutata erythropus]
MSFPRLLRSEKDPCPSPELCAYDALGRSSEKAQLVTNLSDTRSETPKKTENFTGFELENNSSDKGPQVNIDEHNRRSYSRLLNKEGSENNERGISKEKEDDTDPSSEAQNIDALGIRGVEKNKNIKFSSQYNPNRKEQTKSKTI